MSTMNTKSLTTCYIPLTQVISMSKYS